MVIRPILLIALLNLFSLAHPAYADTDLENADLARIKQVLNSLKPLMNEAEREQNPTARAQFHYDWLRSDLANIQQGIDEKLKQAPIEPRTVMPIKGDYITYRSKPL